MGTEMNEPEPAAIIRRVAFWDLKAIARIEEACYNNPWSQDQLEAMLIQPDLEGWGLYLGRRIRAYALLRFRTRHAFLETLTVHPRARRRGHGMALMQVLIDRAAQRGSRCIVTEVHETNLPAQLFYQRTGFEMVKVLHRYFDDGADAYLFSARVRVTQPADEVCS
ncbi:MAG: GNAT family N-acetyltransferase [Planctomycetes bacterium]|nr:GNAT family N-acetyltransferase [Planctomycetota bacterium]